MKEVRMNGVTEVDDSMSRFTSNGQMASKEKEFGEKFQKNANKKIRVSKKDLKKVMVVSGVLGSLTTTALIGVGHVAVDYFHRGQGEAYIYDKLIENGTIPQNLKFTYDNIGGSGISVSYTDSLGEQFSRSNVGIQDYYQNVVTDAIDDGLATEMEVVVALKEAGLEMGTLVNIANVSSEQIRDAQRAAYYEGQFVNEQESTMGRVR